MNILVLATAASDGGALTVLNQLYQEVKDNETQNKWFFAVSTNHLEDTEHIQLLDYAWTKESRLKRLKFDRKEAKKIVEKHNIDLVVSLQNTLVKGVSIPQILYLQQSLPFVDKRYSFKTDRTLWIYQNIISKFIDKSLKDADKIIVQSQWIKDAILKSVQRNSGDVIVSNPHLDTSHLIKSDLEYTNKFFYPANGYKYKNQHLIADAFKDLKDLDYSVDLTVTKDESDYIKEVYTDVQKHKQNINFIGSIPYAEVCKRYSDSVLIFSSEIETFGLPMLEARLSNSIVLALETPFSKEILDGYPNAYTFKDAETLKSLVEKVLKRTIINREVSEEYSPKTLSLYEEIVKFVDEI